MRQLLCVFLDVYPELQNVPRAYFPRVGFFGTFTQSRVVDERPVGALGVLQEELSLFVPD